MDNNRKLPIRKLVEFILRSGDIDSRYAPKDRMAEGSRIHRALQKRNAELYDDYVSEVKLSAAIFCQGRTYLLEGRADGIFTAPEKTVIDEIKTTSLPLELIDEDINPTYWGQAMCYAYIYARQHDLPEIFVRLTYVNVDTNQSSVFERAHSFSQLDTFMTGLLKKYTVWDELSEAWQALRDSSIHELEFPFPQYRKGQRELAVRVYRTIAEGKKLFAQAPTGTGKTVSALFPAVKAMGEGKTSKIFYLTAKTITRQVAEEAFDMMRLTGLRLKTLTLTAKEKICFCDKPVCHPEACAYAKGYFDRANDAVYDVITNTDHVTRSVVEAYARKHTVCPFELSLDISLWVDSLVCDYNYVFDPRAYLRRFFAEEQGDYVFLVDEAHNLVDRSREMFSATLTKSQFFEIKKKMKGHSKALDKILSGINKCMLDFRTRCDEEGHVVSVELPLTFQTLVHDFTTLCERLLKENRGLGEDNSFLQLYFEALNFLMIADFYDERYVTYIDAAYGEVTVKLFCRDPSYLLSEAFKRGGAAVLFSATLTPLDYFRTILGGTEEDRLLSLDSPFDRQHLCLMAADRISTKYKHREQSTVKIARLIGTFVSRKTGNYIIYFPSYKYLKDVYNCFISLYPDIRTACQCGAMTEEEREAFLSEFIEDPQQTLVAFCVLGGLFSEGIDLKGSRLIGTVIVSVGLPQLSVQQNIIKDYFNAQNGLGFEYAYMFPGMNKVLQAAGRVIRCETDTGAVLLIDERFGYPSYRSLFPSHWKDCKMVRDDESLASTLDVFWSGQ